MLILLIILGVLAVACFSLLFFKITAGIVYEYNRGRDQLLIKLKILGLPLAFRIPLHTESKKPKKEKKAKEDKGDKEKKPMTPGRFIALAKSVCRSFKETKQEMAEIIRELRRMVTCPELSLSVQYGARNPALTGILNGAVWTAGTLLLKVADAAIGVTKKELIVKPDFTKEFMCLHFCGMLQFKLVDLLKVVIKIRKLVNLMKSKIEI